DFVARYPRRIVNIHPSILPAFPGLHAIERSYADTRSELGISIHYVDAGVDTGPIIEQHRVERDTITDLASAEAAIHRLEHRYFPEVVVRLLDALTV
ncbi:MAG: formyltransferase family protein, partial [Spirochaetales bacterium]